VNTLASTPIPIRSASRSPATTCCPGLAMPTILHRCNLNLTPLGLAAGPTDVLARQLLEHGVRDVVVTLGERGALWASAAGVQYFDAYPVRAVDTTGAGDAFNAGLTAALVRGEPMESAIVQGCRAGAFCVTRNGVIDGLGSPSDLAQLR
jgi:sugar/nucleoside kinase (ribokinase family)